jgi:hypothetical protein
MLIKVFTDEMNRRRKGGLADEATRLMPPGTRLPVLIGDQHIGWVSMPKASVKAEVTDERALLAFVQEQCPTEIETVQRIRPAFLEALKASVKEHGGWLVRGEVVTVPGVTVRTGDLTPRTEPAKEAFAVVAAALKDGVLDEARGLLAIEGGEEQ